MTRLWPEGEPIEMEVRPNGLPLRFLWRDRWHYVAHVANHWEVRVSWWSPTAAAEREYFKLITDEGVLCWLYRDLRAGQWCCARIFD